MPFIFKYIDYTHSHLSCNSAQVSLNRDEYFRWPTAVCSPSCDHAFTPLGAYMRRLLEYLYRSYDTDKSRLGYGARARRGTAHTRRLC